MVQKQPFNFGPPCGWGHRARNRDHPSISCLLILARSLSLLSKSKLTICERSRFVVIRSIARMIALGGQGVLNSTPSISKSSCSLMPRPLARDLSLGTDGCFVSPCMILSTELSAMSPAFLETSAALKCFCSMILQTKSASVIVTRKVGLDSTIVLYYHCPLELVSRGISITSALPKNGVITASVGLVCASPTVLTRAFVPQQGSRRNVETDSESLSGAHGGAHSRAKRPLLVLFRVRVKA